MSNDDWKTLRVPADKYEAAKAQKEADGRTWGQQIVRPDSDNDSTTNPIPPAKFREMLEETEPLATRDDVDTDELAREVAARIDYAELANKTAEQVVGELQR